MPVYNGSAFLKQAIESILNQTYKLFEFIIINDGSVDNSKEIIKSYNDSRIVYIENIENFGLIKSLNIGVNIAKGEYIARMDADDIALSDRIEKQIKYMDVHKDIGVLGTRSYSIDSKGDILYFNEYPLTDTEIKMTMVSRCPIGHYSVMIRKSILTDHGIYYEEKYKHAEDYALWTKLAHVTNFHCLADGLMLYRSHNSSVSAKFKQIQRESSRIIKEEYLNSIFGSINEFYNQNYSKRILMLKKIRNDQTELYILYKKQIEQSMYLDALDMAESGEFSHAIPFLTLTSDIKRTLNIFKHFAKFNFIDKKH
jgi:glycosyltransferase involved in cell wall biosynthesis